MTVYIGVVGPESIPVKAVTSIINIERQDGDTAPQLLHATKGYVARQMHVNKFMESDHEWLLMLDHDMDFAPDTLQRLLAHDVSFVSGYYMRRQLNPVYSVWYKPFSGEWPHEPFLEEPISGRLYELGGSGWGCILLHKDVIADTRKKVLKGELDVIEDDMDVWPYDLKKVLAGKEQLRILRGVKDEIVGSDIRFPFYAKVAGHQLYGDPDVRPGHKVNYWLGANDFSTSAVGALAKIQAESEQMIADARERIQAEVVKLT